VSTSAVDTWRDVKIRTKNLTEVPNGFTTYDTKQN
jgi:hypothetical protein